MQTLTSPKISAELRRRFDTAKSVLVLTGAGVSAESGVPTFRGGGTSAVWKGLPFEVISSGAMLERNLPAVWEWFDYRRDVLRALEPNAAHYAVASWQERFAELTLVTQNVDGLHQAAGARDVVELHGNLEQVVCLTCGDLTSRTAHHERLAEANPAFVDLVLGVASDGSRVSSQIRPDGDIVLDDSITSRFHLPHCPVCGADTLKPDVVFFGEAVPKPKVERCFDLVDHASSLLVLGSSLAVMSGYRFVRRAARNRIPVAIVTASASRGDPEATIRLHSPLGDTLDALHTEIRALTDFGAQPSGGIGLGR